MRVDRLARGLKILWCAQISCTTTINLLPFQGAHTPIPVDRNFGGSRKYQQKEYERKKKKYTLTTNHDIHTDRQVWDVGKLPVDTATRVNEYLDGGSAMDSREMNTGNG